ncbi:SUKH-4 family immunity protein [Dactylosporangium sp. NPDC000244]|uniref:SUKH-4 family immunity protein n=1 Tax=Dactylosporangium sp. NPDC000244 TaxID=3154365 RepID=UPI00333133DB
MELLRYGTEEARTAGLQGEELEILTSQGIPLDCSWLFVSAARLERAGELVPLGKLWSEEYEARLNLISRQLDAIHRESGELTPLNSSLRQFVAILVPYCEFIEKRALVDEQDGRALVRIEAEGGELRKRLYEVDPLTRSAGWWSGVLGEL